jgi:hypothetical protein
MKKKTKSNINEKNEQHKKYFYISMIVSSIIIIIAIAMFINVKGELKVTGQGILQQSSHISSSDQDREFLSRLQDCICKDCDNGIRDKKTERDKNEEQLLECIDRDDGFNLKEFGTTYNKDRNGNIVNQKFDFCGVIGSEQLQGGLQTSLVPIYGYTEYYCEGLMIKERKGKCDCNKEGTACLQNNIRK